jgi:dienelactone hydrolase
MRSWQSRLRSKVKASIGLPNEPPRPLQAMTHEIREFPQYRRETVRFESRPGLEVFGYFLTPAGCKPKQPAILCLPGHGTGVDSIVGIRPDQSMRPWGEWGDYQNDFALQCVEHGYPTFAIEQVSFGHRRDKKADQAGGGSSSCVRDSMAALMLGETMTGWRVWDAMRALDYLGTRPEVDPKRLATMGISGGGLTSLFVAALDQRVKVAVVSGYLNTWRDSVLAVDHCVDNYAPGLLKLCEMPDFAGLCAPRALFAESGTKDPIFPLHAFKSAVEKLEDIYSSFGAGDRFKYQIFDGDHQFHGKGAFEFIKNML